MLASNVPMTSTYSCCPGTTTYVNSQFDPQINNFSGAARVGINEQFVKTSSNFAPILNYTLQTSYDLRGVNGSGISIPLAVVATP